MRYISSDNGLSIFRKVKIIPGPVEIFEKGCVITQILKSLDVTLRKDKESGRPRINKRGSVLDREQKVKGKWAMF